MCGIVGIIKKNQTHPADTITRMLSVILHRGPDDSGIFSECIGIDEWISLGHNRLSILDLSIRGHQPIISPDQRYVLVYNGEVYNYLEIAHELGQDPILDMSSSDSSVVLAALIRWGVSAFTRFNGMWALALFDRVNKTLLLSRDRMGVKPLYIYQDDRQLLFASEIKSILVGCGQRLKVCRSAATRYLVQSITDAQPETFFEGIVQFPSASYAILDIKYPPSQSISYKKYWKHPYELYPNDCSDSPTVEDIREIFIDAVRLRLRSDVPVGVLLSGGLDSSAIVGAAKEIGLLDRLSILSVVSDDVEANEEPFIDLMAKHTKCNVLKYKADNNPVELLDELDDACWFNDEPILGFSSIAHRNMMRIAHSKNITVLLTGQGSDEQLGGYNKYLYFYLLDCYRKGKWIEIADMLLGCMRERTILGEFRLKEAKRYLPSFFRRYGGNYLGNSLKGGALIDTSLGESYKYREWRDISTLSIPMLLHYEDRMSMSYSREMRLPFMDYRLVDMLGKLEPSEKLKKGWSKAVFRKAMTGILPKEIQYRKDKKGFNLPEAHWMKGAFREKFSKVFNGPMMAEDYGFVKKSVTKEMFSRYLSGDAMINYKEIFHIYCFEVWLKRFEKYLSL